MTEKLYYPYNEYNDDIKKIVDTYEFDSIIALYRGSLPIAVHLSNLTGAPMSIIKYQSYDEKSDTKPTWMHQGMVVSKNILVIDDIYDTGNTMKLTQKFIKEYAPIWNVTYLTIFGKDNVDNVEFLRYNSGKWVVFPWETT